MKDFHHPQPFFQVRLRDRLLDMCMLLNKCASLGEITHKSGNRYFKFCWDWVELNSNTLYMKYTELPNYQIQFIQSILKNS